MRAFFMSLCVLAVACSNTNGGPGDASVDDTAVGDGNETGIFRDDARDARGDTRSDAPRPEGGTDTGVSPGTCPGSPVCDVGKSCLPLRACDDPSWACVDVDSTPSEIGSPSDPVRGVPPDAGTLRSSPLFPRGYCAPQAPALFSATSCNPNTNAGCPSCASCEVLGSQAGQAIVMCVQACEAAADCNPCRSDLSCDAFNGLCLGGCQNNDECRVYREDTNGDGQITFPTANDAGVVVAVDQLVYENRDDIVCNPATARCTHGGTPGARAGSSCVRDWDCEADGICLSPPRFNEDFAGGYCTKLFCGDASRACAGDPDARCMNLGIDLCLDACRVGSETTDAQRFGANGGNPDCRAGLSCVWDGVSTATSTGPTGGCWPGEYNDVSAPNLGAACDENADCFSPYGLGRCLGGSCAIIGCGDPQRQMLNLCGTEGICARTDMTGRNTQCIETCTTQTDCANPENACTAIFTGAGAPKACVDVCNTNDECGRGRTCVGATAMSYGACEGGADAGVGDAGPG